MSSQNPQQRHRPIRRRNADSPPPMQAASIAKASLSSMPSLTAVRRTLFHSSTASRAIARPASQAVPLSGPDGTAQSNVPSIAAQPESQQTSSKLELAPHQLRQDDDEFLYRDAEGKAVFDAPLNMTLLPRLDAADEENQLERSLISDMYREYQSQYNTDAIELKYLLHSSLQEKAASLQEDGWIFGAEEEVVQEQS